MSINDLGFEIVKDEVELELKNGKVIHVKQYLPAEEKNALLEITIQQSDTTTIINTFAIEVFFNLYLVLKYTDIEPTEEEINNPLALYDTLESNGIINEVIAAIPASEYETLTDNLESMMVNYQHYSTSSIVLFDKINSFLQMITEELKKVNPEDIKSIITAFTKES